ncbi:hypothetical protein FACS1894166_12560 [Bacilli bacterium]|nr:hypothetical protein FACS1894166_12560 [Bacilli bacterium]
MPIKDSAIKTGDASTNTVTGSRSTGIVELDKILDIAPQFYKKELEQTNLRAKNRVDQQTGAPISLRNTLTYYPEERVRLAAYYKLLLKYGYNKLEVEFPIKMGSGTKFLDIAVFNNPTEHVNANIKMIVECKRQKANSSTLIQDANNQVPQTQTNMMKGGYEQLISYLSACPNALFGCLTNSSTTQFLKKEQVNGE